MRAALYSMKSYEKPFLEAASANSRHELVLMETRLTAIARTTIDNATDFEQGRVKDANRVGVRHLAPSGANPVKH